VNQCLVLLVLLLTSHLTGKWFPLSVIIEIKCPQLTIAKGGQVVEKAV